MVGFVLNPEQVRTAPPEVRRWLEQQVAQAFGANPEPSMPVRHLVGCTPEQASAVFTEIQACLPVVTVFFELGREPGALTREGVRALDLTELGRLAHLPTVEAAVAALNVIDDVFKNVSGDRQATLFTLDPRGHCYIADATGRSIFGLWQSLVTSYASHATPSESDALRRAQMVNASAGATESRAADREPL